MLQQEIATEQNNFFISLLLRNVGGFLALCNWDRELLGGGRCGQKEEKANKVVMTHKSMVALKRWSQYSQVSMMSACLGLQMGQEKF